MTGPQQELVELEQAFWERAADPAFYRERLTQDAVMAVASATGRQNVQFSEAAPVPLGKDAAALAYRVRAVRAGNPPYETYASSAYVRHGAESRLALREQTTVREEPA